MSSKKIISIGPLQTIEIYSEGNIVLPDNVPAAIIKNNSTTLIRAISYWAPMIGDYNLYSNVDVYPGEVKILARPQNSIYRYRIVVSNLSDVVNAEIEVVMDFLWKETGIPSKMVYMTSNEPFEIYNSGSPILPLEFNDAIIKNNGPAHIRAVNYWAGPFGNYNQYSYIDIYAGRTEILASPPNAINYYKVVFLNLGGALNAELEVMSHLWHDR
ncbi:MULTISPECIES: hypothetical protein [Photorhabdus]|uniref:Uncharacterized protein n=2 Tax=Photorhabdus asymbiotica TaxID=291112 RepID=C7BSM6_PHOAA|nr:hypothetical protein [Photorhabdus asymbiotica]RKS66363.1 hypothetical protein BDD30_0657 [Photorhabdus asymbiotica]CAQ83720.1 conserved hypothetical protein [Photorhabdus asymbiotica]